MGEQEDIRRGIQLASVAMQKLQQIGDPKKVCVALKVKLYGAYVKPIMMYNCGMWGEGGSTQGGGG